MFLFSHFITGSEALHFACSQNGFSWRPLNGGKPLLRSAVSAKSMRDPFIRKGADGLFHLVWTDGWASPRIGHATSPDLLDWSGQDALPVMAAVPDARNTWAPEFIHHPHEKVYYLFWSSTVAPLRGADPRNYKRNHRIWYCTTPDFHTFSEAKVFFDPGYNVIDATVVEFGGAYHMAFKDERGANWERCRHKAMKIARTTRLGANEWEILTPKFITPHLSEGPALFQSGGVWVMVYDEFTRKRYGAVASKDFVDWRPVDTPMLLPHGARHGSIFEVGEDEFEHLRASLER